MRTSKQNDPLATNHETKPRDRSVAISGDGDDKGNPKRNKGAMQKGVDISSIPIDQPRKQTGVVFQSNPSQASQACSGLGNKAITDPDRLAQHVVGSLGRDVLGRLTLRRYRESWWFWDGCKYIEKTQESFNNILRGELDAYFSAINEEQIRKHEEQKRKGKPPLQVAVTSRLVKEVDQAIYRYCEVRDHVEQPAWLDVPPDPNRYISLANGIFNIDAFLNGEENFLREHSPEYFTTVCLPYEYQNDANCPRWHQTLLDNLEGDIERYHLLQEWVGYLLSGRTDLQKFMLLVGEGRNGKTVFLSGVTALLGRDNVSNVPMEQFNDQFALITTLGKLANIAGDMSEISKASEGLIKAYTGGDSMNFNRKFKSAVQAMPTARLMFSTNVLPQFVDRSKGLWRRMSLVPFKREVPVGEVVPGMDNPQWWIDSGELSGIFNWALEGLRRLRENGGFTESQVSVVAVEEYRNDTNSARSFLNEHYCEAPDDRGFMLLNEVYSDYKAWCKESGYATMNKATFSKEIPRMFPGVTRERKQIARRRETQFKGISRHKPD